MRRSLLVTAAAIAVTLAACGGGGSGSSQSGSSAAASNQAPPAAASGDARMVAPQNYADSHPMEAEVPYGHWCSHKPTIAEITKAYGHLSFVALKRGSQISKYGTPAACIDIEWAASIDSTRRLDRGGYPIGHYVIEKIGADASNDASTISIPWSGHFSPKSAYAPLAAINGPKGLPMTTLTDGTINDHQGASGLVIDQICMTQTDCGGLKMFNLP